MIEPFEEFKILYLIEIDKKMFEDLYENFKLDFLSRHTICYLNLRQRKIIYDLIIKEIRNLYRL